MVCHSGAVATVVVAKRRRTKKKVLQENNEDELQVLAIQKPGYVHITNPDELGVGDSSLEALIKASTRVHHHASRITPCSSHFWQHQIVTDVRHDVIEEDIRGKQVKLSDRLMISQCSLFLRDSYSSISFVA